MPKSEESWTPDTIHLDYMVAKVDPDFVHRQGRMRYNREACKTIERSEGWYASQPAEFKKWLNVQIAEFVSYCLPRAWNNLMEIASGDKKGARAGEQVAAIKLFMERFDPDFKRDRGETSIRIDISQIVADLDEAPYAKVTYDTDTLPQEELPAPEDSDFRDDAVREPMGEGVG